MTVDTQTTAELTAIMIKLDRVVSEYWATFQRPILFSKLGGFLTQAERNAIKLSSGTLASFIGAKMRETTRVLSLTRFGGGVAPLEVSKNIGEGELEARVRTTPKTEPGQIRESSYIYPTVWNAFSLPPKDSLMFFEFGENGEPIFHAVNEQDEAEEGWLPIEPSDLPKSALEQKFPTAAETHSAIRAWASRHGISIDRLKPAQRPRGTLEGKSAADRGISQPLFLGLARLSASELARIMIPADLVGEIVGRGEVR